MKQKLFIFLWAFSLLIGSLHRSNLYGSTQWDASIARDQDLFETLYENFKNSNKLTLKEPRTKKVFIFYGGITPLRNLGKYDSNYLKIITIQSNYRTKINNKYFFRFLDKILGNFPEPLPDHNLFESFREFNVYLEWICSYLNFWKFFFTQQRRHEYFPQRIEFYQQQIWEIQIHLATIKTIEGILSETIDSNEKIEMIGESYGKLLSEEDSPSFQDLFNAEILLFYVIKNNITIEGFNFGTLKK